MITAESEQNILVKDADGNWYSIPPSLQQEFIRIKEETINLDFGSREWHSANSEMQEIFGAFIK